MAAGNTYTPIATTTLASAVASYTFSSIPGTYTDLVLVYNSTTFSSSDIYMQFNGDTATNYSATRLYGQFNNTAQSDRLPNEAFIRTTIGGTGSPSNAIININNYSNTTTNKSVLLRHNTSTSYVGTSVGLWRSTVAINSIKLYGNIADLIAGTTFTLYGIKAA